MRSQGHTNVPRKDPVWALLSGYKVWWPAMIVMDSDIVKAFSVLSFGLKPTVLVRCFGNHKFSWADELRVFKGSEEWVVPQESLPPTLLPEWTEALETAKRYSSGLCEFPEDNGWLVKEVLQSTVKKGREYQLVRFQYWPEEMNRWIKRDKQAKPLAHPFDKFLLDEILSPKPPGPAPHAPPKSQPDTEPFRTDVKDFGQYHIHDDEDNEPIGGAPPPSNPSSPSKNPNIPLLHHLQHLQQLPQTAQLSLPPQQQPPSQIQQIQPIQPIQQQNVPFTAISTSKPALPGGGASIYGYYVSPREMAKSGIVIESPAELNGKPLHAGKAVQGEGGQSKELLGIVVKSEGADAPQYAIPVLEATKPAEKVREGARGEGNGREGHKEGPREQVVQNAILQHPIVTGMKENVLEMEEHSSEKTKQDKQRDQPPLSEAPVSPIKTFLNIPWSVVLAQPHKFMLRSDYKNSSFSSGSSVGSSGTPTITDWAFLILCRENRAMRIKDLTNVCLEENLITTTSANPAKMMSKAISVEIKKCGTEARIARSSPGAVSVSTFAYKQLLHVLASWNAKKES
eukprot:TRINITY_DN21639_c0_g1_i1.p1 TRINITY_DN21639_c0_g1~~TRINITY_DN21639_c0_g1_i1.p1  ORF type:complete len:568 (+),score=142.34 TRINITY_DN21639_c0_g1_i1:84-1787(+)